MCICGIYAYVYIHIYVCIYVCVCIYIYICGNTAYRAIEPLRITAREIPSPRQPYFTVQMDNDPKHSAKATKEFLKGKKWTVMQWPSQSPDLNPIEHAFHLLKTKLKGKCPKNKQELKTVAVEAWQSITRDETQRLVMSMRSRLQAVIDCKGFATKY